MIVIDPFEQNSLFCVSGNATKDELPTESINFFKVDDLKVSS